MTKFKVKFEEGDLSSDEILYRCTECPKESDRVPFGDLWQHAQLEHKSMLVGLSS